MQERLWMTQQRIQEIHRRRLYHRSSSHPALVLILLYYILLYLTKSESLIYTNQTSLLVRDHVMLMGIHQRNIPVEMEEVEVEEGVEMMEVEV